ncbi:MAG: BamA/TamA family outer membrane protein [Candidatus Marinimicrobia bacterium]|jgi:Tol biopolymer transport system component|nr:BamA/TamA family outer membrane protein [Candidatus Neomarinimicrobiota bacterium]MBT7941090.1 BamA/TamA family outer membrane protein [Candidatus Neomarinimicrobiota bacterium]
MKMYNKTLFLFLIVLSSKIFGQFGQNIVQYDGFTWSFIKSAHFDIYFSEDGYSHAEFAAIEAEKAYVNISTRLLGDLQERVSIIIYNSHNGFQQTNVIDSYMYEGIGGVTELFKNRVVIPYDGSHKQFAHVIHHELVHAFINDNIYGGNLQSLLNSTIKFQIPGWMNEGLAEYLASGWDTNSDMWLRDLAINGGDLPNINMLGGYWAYRGGQSVWKFITDKWGDEVIAEVFTQIKRKNNVEKGIENSLGVDIDELTEQWHKYLKKQYWPDIEGRESLQDIARKLTDHEKLGNTYNISPALSPDGKQMAIISNKDGQMAIYLLATEDGVFIKKIIQGERNAEYEELHILKPGITWSPNGDRLAFPAKSGKSDALFIVDHKTEESRKYRFGMEGIFRATWNPVKDEIAFIGNDGITSDIYIFDIETEELTNLTNDWFTDDMVSWSPDGKSLYFISDRGDHLDTSVEEMIEEYPVDQADIYSITRDGSHITRITNTPFIESYPTMSFDGQYLAYISDESGINNIYLLSDSLDSSFPITNILTGVSQLSWSRDDTQLICSGFEDGGYDIFTIDNPKDKRNDNISIPPAKWVTSRDIDPQKLLIREDNKEKYQPSVSYENYVFNNFNSIKLEEKPEIELTNEDTKDTTGTFRKYRYKTRFTLDLIQPYYNYSAQYNPQMMAYFLWSDLLGDHKILLSTEMNDISLKNSDYFFMYRYLPMRTDINFMFSHNSTINQQQGSFLVRLRKLALEVLASRPFSRFNRFEYGLEYAYAEQTMIIPISNNSGYIEFEEQKINSIKSIMPTFGLIWDNTIWSYLYPIDGDRVYFRYQISPGNKSNSLEFQTFSIDARHYIPLGNGVSIGARLYAGYSQGKNAEIFRVGGLPWLFSSEDTYYANFDELYEDYSEDNLKEIFFTKYVMPVRGAQINELYGNKAVVINLELRTPFLLYYFPTIKYFGQINGVLFTDFGMAWSDKRPDMWEGNSWDSHPQDFVLTYGFGPRFIFLGMPWQLDYAWEYIPHEKTKRMWYLTIGLDF